MKHIIEKNAYELAILDKSYVHEKISSNYSFKIGDYRIKRVGGKGRRVVMFGVLTRDGWLGKTLNLEKDLRHKNLDQTHSAGSIKYFIANRSGNYHKNFDNDLFVDLFKRNVLAKLKANTLIIMDRARYHYIFEDREFLPKRARKDQLLKEVIELVGGDYDHEEDPFGIYEMRKQELLEVILHDWRVPKTEIEKIAEKAGHKVMFLPQYHPEYNAIELAWGFTKNWIRRNNLKNMNELTNILLPKALHE
jgi:DDE superfamily endonuclease